MAEIQIPLPFLFLNELFCLASLLTAGKQNLALGEIENLMQLSLFSRFLGELEDCRFAFLDLLS